MPPKITSRPQRAQGAPGPNGRHAAEDGAVVGFFSLEMSAEQLATRILAEESGVSSDRIRRGDVSHEDFDKFVQASQRLAAVKLFIDDTPALSVAALRTRARRLMRQQGLGLIVIDYLQLLRPSNQARAQDNRVQEISEITRGLKALAKELDVPVLALSQLSRAVEQREDKRPILADLRESGSIEQDADVVMFIFREEYYLSREPTRRPDEAENKYSERYQDWRERLEKVHGLGEDHRRQAAPRPDRHRQAPFRLPRRPNSTIIRRPTTCHRRISNGVRDDQHVRAERAGAVLEIDLAGIAANWRLLARLVEPASCAAVVKADGYGLGAPRRSATALAAAGCRLFFVATIDEGIALRAGLPERVEIAVLNGISPGCAAEFVGHRLLPVLNDRRADRRMASR